MSKKIVALLTALVLVLALAACTPAPAPAATPTPAPAATDAPAADPTEAPPAVEEPGELITLKYYWIGNADTPVRESVQNSINAYIEPLINANIEFSIIGWGDWDNKALTALQAGEDIDIMFTADWKSYYRSVTQNLFMPLNDDNGEYGNLLATYGAGILETINPAFITGTQIDGVNYAVPTQKELSVPMGYIYNAKAAEEVGMDPTTIKKTEDFEPYLKKYKELHPDQYPYLADGSWGFDPFVGPVNNPDELLVFYHNPKEDGSFDETLYFLPERQEWVDYCKTMWNFANAGYIDPDSSLDSYSNETDGEFASEHWLTVSKPLKGDNIKGIELVNASGNLEMKVGEIYGQAKTCITTHAGGSMLAIPMTAQDPRVSMKYINLMHTDTKLIDMQLFGTEGEQWEFADDGRVKLLDPSWFGAHGGAWTVGNTALQDVTTDEDPNKNAILRDYGLDAVPHVSLGFRYICPPELEAQWAAVQNVTKGYKRALTTGALDPDVNIPKYITELKAAGIDDIKADIEAKFKEWRANQ